VKKKEDRNEPREDVTSRNLGKEGTVIHRPAIWDEEL
jgi:hypothetical protein